jgi:predicted dinucleotide-binding enzyme
MSLPAGSAVCPARTHAAAHEPFSAASWLSTVLPASATVVKSFNNLSAYALLHGDPLTEHMKSVAASNDRDAAEAVAALGRAMGLQVSRAV